MKRGNKNSRRREQRANKTRRPDPGPTDSKRPDPHPDTDARGGSGGPPSAADDWFRRAQIVVPELKQAISFRVDPDVLDFFKGQGPRYQTRMNAVLRAYMTAHAEEE